MNRMPSLLRKAADALDDGQIPLMNPFLADNEVTYDECVDMADFLALGARLMAWVVEDPKRAGLAFQGAADRTAMAGITEALRRLNETGRRT